MSPRLRLPRLALVGVLLVVAIASAGAQPPLGEGGAVLPPGDNLTVEGIPPLSASLVESVGRYTEFRAASFADWHPTCREMLIQTRFADTAQVHRVTMPGGARTQLTFFPDGVRGARYEPKRGDYFVFSKDTGGNEFAQNYRYDLATGEVTLLTDGKSRNSLGDWSRKGDRLAYTSTRRNGRDTDLYVVDPRDPKTDRLVAPVDGSWDVLDWSPDDRSLLVGQYISVNESYLWRVDVTTGEKTPLTPSASKDAEPVAYSGGKFSPDGKGVYTATDRGGEFARLAYLDLATGACRFLTSDIPWDVEDFDLSPDGRTVAFVTNEDGISVLRLRDVRTSKDLKVPRLPAGVLGGLKWRPDGKELAFQMNSARSATDVYSLDVKTGRVERWTESETGGLPAETFAEPKLIRWKGADGRALSGFLYPPPAAKFPGKRPVLINIHGGPEGQSRPVFIGRNNYFLNEMGVALLYPNVRGSTGYGKTFVRLDNGMKREDAYTDLGALFDWIKTQPDLDADRVMVLGGSYGGHMVLAVSTRYPDRIACAVDVVGISNFVTFLERTEAYRRDLRRVEYGDERDPATRAYFEKTAPLNNADRVKKPLFIVQGRNDPRVPYTEAIQMKEAVAKNGVPVWFLMAADEGHGFAKKKNADFQFYATVQFMKEYLLK